MMGVVIINYLSELLKFYDTLLYNDLEASEISLWHALMFVANKTRWQERFNVSIDVLELYSGLKRTTLYKARNKLSDLGFIEFKKQGSNGNAEYKLRSPGERETTRLYNNNKQNNTSNKIRQTHTRACTPACAIPPTLEQIVEFCKQRESGVNPEKFFQYYSLSDWCDKNGEKINNWQQKLISWEGFDTKKTEQKQTIAPSVYETAEFEAKMRQKQQEFLNNCSKISGTAD